MVITDPILLTEFLNTTNYGDPNKNNWKKGEPFKLRPYQREIITDKTRNLVITGGRSIGKCQPRGSKVFTTEGYLSMQALEKRTSFSIYAVDTNNKITMRRAVVRKDLKKPLYTLKTESGHVIRGTDVHPLLTKEGYRLMDTIRPGEFVAVAHRLPTNHCYHETIQWHEARFIGYTYLRKFVSFEGLIKPRFEAIREEFKHIADRFHTKFSVSAQGIVRMEKEKGLFKHPTHYLLREFGIIRTDKHYSTSLRFMMRQKLDIQRVFIEALFAQYGTLRRDKVSITFTTQSTAAEMQEMLLYFGVETRITGDGDKITVTTLNDRAAYVFWTTFELPGVAVGNLVKPAYDLTMINEWFRWDMVESNTFSPEINQTYAVHVYKDETYISENIVNHNSVILENLTIYQIVNSDSEFPQTPEQVLATPNQNQLTPLLDKIILRFTSSPFLKDFLKNNINRAKGTMDFPVFGRVHRFYARIAGSKSENNIVGLHVNKVAVDEAQLFPMPTYYQMSPILNTWEQKAQQMYTGVHNGIRNMVLYQLDQKVPSFKKYRIPSPNNPYFTYQDWVDSIKRYGGEDTDLFLQLVLAKPGSASFSVVNREAMIITPDEFYNYKYNATDKAKGLKYTDTLKLPKLPTHDKAMLAVDTGFVDPTIIQLFVLDKGRWRCVVRWKLQRIDFPEQEEILDWIATYYNIRRIALDIGAGGGGSGMMQSLIARAEYAGKNYQARIIPVNFSDVINIGDINKDEVINVPVKSYAGIQVAKMVEAGSLVFSELDMEGISQIERIAKQRTPSGFDKYFVMSDRGTGASSDDHIFASYVCFIMGIEAQEAVPVKKLAQGLVTTTNK